MERCYYYSDSVNVATEMNALGIKKLVITGCLNPFKCHYLVVCISALTTSQVFGIEKAKKENLSIQQKMETNGDSETKDTPEPVRQDACGKS